MAETAADIHDWLVKAHGGSREALGDALESCRAYLLLIANRELDPELRAKGGASDLVQETFLEAQRDFGQFHGNDPEELRAWLRQILIHNQANFTRRYRATDKRNANREVAWEFDTPSGSRDVGLAADTPSPSGQAMASEQTRRLEEAIAKLPEDYRQIIVARHQEGRAFDEIAQTMQRSENAVRKLWFRAVERLQQEMETPS